jgi:hypothetical protein
MHCCLSTIFLVLASRFAIVMVWLFDPSRFPLAFKNWIFPPLVWAIAGGIFLPWTTLAYLILFDGGIMGYKWLVLALALLVDLAGHGGSLFHGRRFLPF